MQHRHGDERQGRGWFLCEDGRWRAYDGYDAEPIAVLRLSARAANAGTFLVMQQWLDEVSPAVRIVA
jgi:hypothetical protein